MSRAKLQSNLLGLVDSDSETEDNSTASKKSYEKAPEMPAVKKDTRGRPAANRVTKPAPTSSRRASGRIAAAVEKADPRTALAEKSSNEQRAGAGRGRKASSKAALPEDVSGAATTPRENATRAKGTRGRPKTVKPVQAEQSKEVPDSIQKATVAQGGRRGRKPAKAAEESFEESEIPETQQQPDAMDLDLEEESVQVEDLPAYQPPVPASVQRQPYQVPYSVTRRLPAASDNESDPTIRRRLGDLTKKYEVLETKYRDLRDIGIREAERNFDRLKKQSEERTQAANQLVSSLKNEVASQKELAKEGQRFKKQLEASETKVDNLQARIDDLTKSLTDAKMEIKTLSARLAAARTTEAKVPGSALKAGTNGGRLATNADNVQANQAAQMKEDLYGDLTGLIVRGVKRNGAEDVFDCIQTGRNGTLHFKLAIGNETSENYDEAEFMYMPQLDPSRDEALVDMLPDYLVEEITFPRPHAAKFYSRLMRSMTERLE